VVAQLDVFSQQLPRANADVLMSAVDRISHSGLGKICFAGEGTDNA